MRIALFSSFFCLAFAASSQASLWVDFNSNQDGGGTPVPGNPADATNATHNNAGWSSYHARHEVAGDFITATYATTFAITGAANVSVTPAWPNTTDNRVQQMIDRGAGNDANWTGTDINLVTDWLGIDTRTGGGGNGNWDGTTGTPTTMTLTLSGLPAGTYNWTSFHHDTEHVHTDFAVSINTGAGTVALPNGYMSDSTPAGSPDSALDGSPGPVADFAGMLSVGAIYNATFTADGVNDVVFEFAPFSGTYGNAVHNQLWGINGFQLEQIPEPSTSLLGLLGLTLLLRRRR